MLNLRSNVRKRRFNRLAVVSLIVLFVFCLFFSFSHFDSDGAVSVAAATRTDASPSLLDVRNWRMESTQASARAARILPMPPITTRVMSNERVGGGSQRVRRRAGARKRRRCQCARLPRALHRQSGVIMQTSFISVPRFQHPPPSSPPSSRDRWLIHERPLIYGRSGRERTQIESQLNGRRDTRQGPMNASSFHANWIGDTRVGVDFIDFGRSARVKRTQSNWVSPALVIRHPHRRRRPQQRRFQGTTHTKKKK